MRVRTRPFIIIITDQENIYDEVKFVNVSISSLGVLVNRSRQILLFKIYLSMRSEVRIKYNYIFIIYLKSIKSIISENVINCCLASSALTQF
jgi:hypothetical protein